MHAWFGSWLATTAATTSSSNSLSAAATFAKALDDILRTMFLPTEPRRKYLDSLRVEWRPQVVAHRWPPRVGNATPSPTAAVESSRPPDRDGFSAARKAFWRDLQRLNDASILRRPNSQLPPPGPQDNKGPDRGPGESNRGTPGPPGPPIGFEEDPLDKEVGRPKTLGEIGPPKESAGGHVGDLIK
jgi:hypothetical protein